MFWCGFFKTLQCLKVFDIEQRDFPKSPEMLEKGWKGCNDLTCFCYGIIYTIQTLLCVDPYFQTLYWFTIVHKKYTDRNFFSGQLISVKITEPIPEKKTFGKLFSVEMPKSYRNPGAPKLIKNYFPKPSMHA